MKNLLRFLGTIGLVMSNLTAQAGCLLAEYWPMRSGDIRYYSGTGPEIKVEVESGFELDEYEFHVYEYDPEEDDYFSAGYGIFGYSGDTLLEYGFKLGWNRYTWDPPLPDLNEDLLCSGGSRTVQSVLRTPGPDYAVTVTITVGFAGTVAVPAGTFDDCRSVSVKAKTTIDGRSRTVSAQAWVLAPKVGQIRIGVLNSAGERVGWQSLTGGTVGGLDVKELTSQALPSLSISTPRVGEKLAAAWATVRGTARDNVRVASVWRQINGLGWELAETTNGWANWSATVSLIPGTNKFCAFAVDSIGNTSVVRTASIVYDPFLEHVGGYTGLFYDSNAVAHGSSGFFKAKVRAGGLFSATFQNGSRKFPFTGRFDLDGKTINSVGRKGTNALMVELCFDFLGSETISGRVTDGAWSARLMADRAVFHGITNPATAFTNKYTMLIPGSNNGAAEPEGHGFGAVTVSKAGLLKFAGTLADGSPVSQSVALSRLGDWAFYLSLGKVKGSMLGWLRVAPSTDNHIAGRVEWIRPAGQALKSYTNGFAFQSLVEGSVYRPAGTNQVLDWDSGAVVFSGGNFTVPFSNMVALGPGSRVTNLGPHKMTFTIVPPSGLFNATVQPPGSTRSYPFKGAVLQHQGYGGGYLLNSNLSSRVYLGPYP